MTDEVKLIEAAQNRLNLHARFVDYPGGEIGFNRDVRLISRPSNPDAVKLAEAGEAERDAAARDLENSLAAHLRRFGYYQFDFVLGDDGGYEANYRTRDWLKAMSRQPYPAPDVERVAQRFSERASDTLHGMFDWDGVSDAQWEELTIKLYDVAADELTALTGDTE